MGGVSNAIASSARAAGVEIRTNCSVKHIDIRNSKVEGVVLENGEEIKGKIVASNATGYTTFKDLILNDVIQTNTELVELKRHILQMDYSSGTTKINLALSGLPNFLADPNKTNNEFQPHHQCTIHMNSESIPNLHTAYQEALNGKPSKHPLIEMVIPSTLDPTIAPKGCHVALLFTQYTPYRLPNGKQIEINDEYKENYYRTVINEIEQYAPGFEKLIIGRDMLFPSDLEEQFSLTGGNIFHDAWYYVQGGMGGVSNAIASSARAAGVEIRTNCSVKHIDIRNSKVEGVVLENGEGIKGKIVASNATGYTTFKDLILNDVIQTNAELVELKRHILQMDYSSGTTKINLALSGLPNFLADPNKTNNEFQPHHQCTIHMNSESIPNLHTAYQEALNGKPSKHPLIEMVIPSTLDPTIAPKGCHVALLFTQYTPYRLPNGKQIEINDEYKENYYRTVINEIEQYAPGFEKL
ncbi:unnamed protein product, partial [Adineta steineri]